MNVNKIKKSSKFSNISVFDRRDENILYVKNLKRYIPLKLTNVKRKVNRESEIKKKNEEINDILYSFYVYQISEANRENTINDSNNPTFMSLFDKTYNSNFKKISSPFYLTETDHSSYKETNSFRPNKKSSNKYFKLKKNYTEENNKIENSTTTKSVFPNNSKIFSKLSDYFQEKENVKTKTPKIGYNKTFDLLEMKSNKLRGVTQNNFYNAKQYIDKTRTLMLMKYNSLIKKEVKLRIDEKKDNSIQLMNEKMNSLNKLKKFENKVFDNKLTEYVKFIKLKQDNEEKNDLSLINQIYSLKREISSLTNKIRKKQIEKNNIIHWILLQIKIKERKLYLPEYYSKIMEMNIPKGEKQRRLAKIDILNSPGKKNRKSKQISVSKEKMKIITNNSDNILNEVNEDEIKKILYYRQNLVFKTADDFIEEIKAMENKNIKLFQKTDMLLNDIKKLRNKYNILLNDKDLCNSSLIIQIKKDENELEREKKIYKEKKKFISENLKYNKINKNKDINIQLIDNEIELNNKKSKLFSYVEKLFSTCKDIKLKKNPTNSNIDNIIINTNKCEEEVILNMFEFIEIKITRLLIQISVYKNQKKTNNDLIKKLRTNFAKQRYIEKAKIEFKKKNLKLFHDFEVKNKQFLFLKKNKKALNNHLAVINSQIKNKKRKKIKIIIPKFEDFLFSDDLDNNNNEYYTYK